MFDRQLDALDRYQRTRRPLAFAIGVMRKFSDDEASTLAALVAYYGFFSLFPLLLVVVSLSSILLEDHEDAQQALVDSALGQFPLVGDQLATNIGEVQGSGLALVVGLALALWAGTGALEAAQRALNVVWGLPRSRRPGAIGSRLRSFAMLAVLGVGLAASAAVTTLSATLGVGLVGRTALVVGSLLVAFGLFLAAYRLLPAVSQPLAALWPGAALAGAAWVALQTLGVVLLDRQLRGSSQLYGTFALVLGLLSWLYLQAQATVLGAEVNAVRAGRLWPRPLRG